MFCELRVKSILNALLTRKLDGPVGRANGKDYGSTWFKSQQCEIIPFCKIQIKISGWDITELKFECQSVCLDGVEVLSADSCDGDPGSNPALCMVINTLGLSLG